MIGPVIRRAGRNRYLVEIPGRGAAVLSADNVADFHRFCVKVVEEAHYCLYCPEGRRLWKAALRRCQP
jgi:hypothetical protein